MLCAATLVLLASSAAAQLQLGNVASLINAGQLNQAAVQQIAQAFGGQATNLAGVTQVNAGEPPDPRKCCCRQTRFGCG